MKGNEPKYKLNGDSNLLHLCNKCHDEIDRLYPEDYSIERLLSFKFGSNLMAYVPSFNYSYLMTKCINRIASSLYKSRGRFYYSRAKTLYCRFMHRYDHRLSSEFEFKVSEIISKVWIGSPLMDDFTDEISIIMNKPIDLTLRLYQVRNSEAFLYFLRFHIINFTYRIEDPKNREFVKKRLNHAFLACVDILETLYICLGHDNYREFFKIPLKISLNTYSYEIFKSNIDSIRLSLHDDRLKLEDVWNLVYDEDLNAVDEPEKLLKS